MVDDDESEDTEPYSPRPVIERGPGLPVPPKIGAWTVGRRVGGGAQGRIHHCIHDHGRKRVIKLFAPVDHHPTAIHRFEDEVAIYDRVVHPNVVKKEDSGVHEGMPYLVLEPLHCNLRQRMARGVPLNLALSLVAEALLGVQAVHDQQIIHRDLKPENIGVTIDDHAKLLDFGIAKFVREDSLTLTGEILGTYGYKSPEQLTGGTVTPRADIYSLGVVLWELITGRALLVSEVDGVAILSRIGGPIGEIVGRATARDPSERYSEAREMADALLELLRSMR